MHLSPPSQDDYVIPHYNTHHPQQTDHVVGASKCKTDYKYDELLQDFLWLM